MYKHKKNNELGITLIALVVTIIVLLILAGISIMMLTGSNGILTRAGEAKEEVIVGQEKESVELAYVSAAVKKLGDDVTDEELQHELDLSVGAGKTEVEGQTILDVLFKDTNHSYTVENGKVEKNGPVVNPFDPDEWEFAWVYPTTDGTWSEKITDKALIPQNYKIIAKLYEGKESGVKYSLVIEGKGEIKDLFVASSNSDPDNYTPPECYAWQTGFFSSEGPLFAQEGNTVNVRICDGITGIGDSAFGFCLGSKSIKISNTVTSIGNGAFQYCNNLQNIKMSNSITSIGEYAFQACSNLANVNIPNSVTSIEEYTFNACGLTSIKIPDRVTSIGYCAFCNCVKLKNVEMSNSVTSIGDRAFEDCNYLTNLKMSSSITSIGYSTFAMCCELQSIEIPNGVTTIGENAFYYCSSFKSIEIPNTVTTIGDKAFCGCSGLTTTIIEIPNSVTSIGNSAFAYCTSLRSIEISNSVTSMGNEAFKNCSSLTEIIIHKQEDSITGAKWGAPDSTKVTWVGE